MGEERRTRKPARHADFRIGNDGGLRCYADFERDFRLKDRKKSLLGLKLGAMIIYVYVEQEARKWGSSAG
jgi:hypothetical protein